MAENLESELRTTDSIWSDWNILEVTRSGQYLESSL
jgi:hypothetical protein